MAKPRLNNHVGGLGLVLSGSILSWLNIKKEEQLLLPNSSAATRIDPDSQLVETIRLAAKSIHEGNGKKGEELLHIALRMAQDLHHYNGETYIFTLLASLSFQQEEYLKAENLYKTVIQRQINKGIDEDNNGIIEMSLKLAKIYGEWKDHDKAKTGFDFCIKAQETKMKSKGDTSEDTHALWGMSRDWYAQYLLNNGKHKEAFNQFQDAFLISCELFGNTHPQSLVLLNSLGTVCSLMGEEARAVSYFTKAVNVGKKTASENLSTFMVNLGMAKIKQGLTQEANAVCNEALLIARRNQMSEVVAEAQACINLTSV